MLKLNASYSKKVPAEGEYSSQSYHASIEVEIPDGLTQDQLEAKIHETFDMVRNSVESELHRGSLPLENAPKSAPQGYTSATRNYAKKTQQNQDTPASPKQIKFLLDLARTAGMSPQQIATKFNLASVDDLSRTQCSKAIDELNGRAA